MLIFQEKPGHFSSDCDKKDSLPSPIGATPPGWRKSPPPRGKGAKAAKKAPASGGPGAFPPAVMLSAAKHPLPVTAGPERKDPSSALGESLLRMTGGGQTAASGRPGRAPSPRCHAERSEASFLLRPRGKKRQKPPGILLTEGARGLCSYLIDRAGAFRGRSPAGSGCQTPPASPAAGHRRSPAARTGRCSPPRPPHR